VLDETGREIHCELVHPMVPTRSNQPLRNSNRPIRVETGGPAARRALLSLVVERHTLRFCQSSVSLPPMNCFSVSTGAASSGQFSLISSRKCSRGPRALIRYSVAEPSTGGNRRLCLESRPSSPRQFAVRLRLPYSVEIVSSCLISGLSCRIESSSDW
jgi:hypothetical protein